MSYLNCNIRIEYVEGDRETTFCYVERLVKDIFYSYGFKLDMLIISVTFLLGSDILYI